ncbi:MAG: alpha,alpha-trehalase TreF [Bacteroidota bacterium]
MKFLPPDQVFQELFIDQHRSGIWPDGKTISDMTPKFAPAEILSKYRKTKDDPGFDLKKFTEDHFEIPTSKTSGFVSDPSRPIDEHINLLWDWLKREADQARPGSSLIPLPHPYIVPGGRFNEIYYWDSYFTMLGLQVSGQVEIIEHMVGNFAYLIDEIGFIPNGNRTYFTGRSQPPFFALMVSLLAEENGEKVLVGFLPQLLKEHAFWMKGEENSLRRTDTDSRRTRNRRYRVVQLDGENHLNRYYDNFHSPRAEMYSDDLETAAEANRASAQLYLDLRAACESGWDFSARWLRQENDLSSIHTSEIVPVDLNCLLYFLEKTISKALHSDLFISEKFKDLELPEKETFENKAATRKNNILKYHWSEEHGFFMDYDFIKNENTAIFSLAGMFPLFFELADQGQAEKCAKMISEKFLRPGGVVSTPIHSGQQWDAPNGWAPLQYMTITGLKNYGFHELADEIKNRWINLNKRVFKNTGKMLEKYNVENIDLLSGGGEYPVQDGFGWTNGVLLKLLNT